MVLAVEEAIDTLGYTKFQDVCKCSISSFVNLLKLYLHGAFIEYGDSVYEQKDGIAIGSCIAPVLSDLFLSVGDRKLAALFGETNITTCFRYVDDYLVCMKENQTDPCSVETVISMFKKAHEV